MFFGGGKNLMENITYYIGAGASANALPLYSGFEKRLELFRDYVYHFQKDSDEAFKQKANIYLKALDRLIQLLDNSLNSTLDILAHELYNRRHSNEGFDLYQLKYLISDFFVFEQTKKQNKIYLTQQPNISVIGHYDWYSDEITKRVNTSVEPRYKNFILPTATENRNGLKIFPSNTNFISWNYDLQFELSYAQIHGCSINLAQQNLQVFPSPQTKNGISLEASSIIKVNGTAGIYYPDNTSGRINNFIYENRFDFTEDYITAMIETFSANYRRVFGGLPFFKFYFEDHSAYHKNAMTYAEKILAKTDLLVVIGYSFHTSNREIDKAVFESANNIKKVIIQTLPNDFELIKYNLIKTNPRLASVIEPYPLLDNFPTPNNI